MATVGRAALILALAVALYGIGVAVYGAVTGQRRFSDSARHAVFAFAGLASVAAAILVAAFVRSDFAFEVVATHSSTTTPLFYRVAAAWSSQEGSLMLWVLLLGLFSSLVLHATRRRLRDVTPWATAVLLGFMGFFAALMVFSANPFAQLAVAPAEGTGLQPLLRHPAMMIHPPMLYGGYVLFTVPFAFAVGALLARRVDAEWIAVTRRYALGAWLLLGIGILLGARWSYQELGWGGYWAWDPVENASLLPWLTGTAFLHSVMLQERRGMLKVWNASLILGTGILCILGTFLVRSGILDSIHAFGASTLGVPFILFIAVLLLGSTALVLSRLDVLRSEQRLDSLLSRESVFLFNNLVLVALAAVVLFLTFFPLIAEALTGQKRAIGPPVFDRYVVPLSILLVLLSGIGPVIAWRRATPANARRTFAVPLGAAAVTLVALVALGVTGSGWALAMFVVAGFVVGTIGQELVRGTVARRAMTSEAVPVAVVRLIGRNRRRYGGYVVHLGIVVLFVGVAASSAFQKTDDVRLSPGDSRRLGDVTVTYVRATSDVDIRADAVEKLTLGADLRYEKDGRVIADVHTERGYYPAQTLELGPVGRYFEGESTSEVALDEGLRHDIWAAVAPDQQRIGEVIQAVDRRIGPDATPVQAFAAAATFAEIYRRDPPPATFRIIVSPMVMWLWIGALIAFVGGGICLGPARSPDLAARRATAGYAGRVARELGRA